MSLPALRWVRGITEVSITEKALLLVLAERADKKGTCWPSYNTLARDLGCSRRTVIRGVQSLAQKDLIRPKHRASKYGGHTSNVYQLGVAYDRDLVPPCHHPSDTVTPGWCHSDTPITLKHSVEAKSEAKNCAGAQWKPGDFKKPTGERKNTSPLSLVKNPSAAEKLPEKKTGETEMKRPLEGKTIAQILADTTEGLSREKVLHEAEHLQAKQKLSLASLWAKLVLVETGTKPDLNVGEQKNLKTFYSNHPTIALEVVDICISNWVEFTNFAKQDAGAFSLPYSPQAGFFIKYRNAAVRFAKQQAEAAQSIAQIAAQQAGEKTRKNSLTTGAGTPTVKSDKPESPEKADAATALEIMEKYGL